MRHVGYYTCPPLELYGVLDSALSQYKDRSYFFMDVNHTDPIVQGFFASPHFAQLVRSHGIVNIGLELSSCLIPTLTKIANGTMDQWEFAREMRAGGHQFRGGESAANAMWHAVYNLSMAGVACRPVDRAIEAYERALKEGRALPSELDGLNYLKHIVSGFAMQKSEMDYRDDDMLNVKALEDAFGPLGPDNRVGLIFGAHHGRGDERDFTGRLRETFARILVYRDNHIDRVRIVDCDILVDVGECKVFVMNGDRKLVVFNPTEPYAPSSSVPAGRTPDRSPGS